MIEDSTAEPHEHPQPIIWRVLDAITASQKTALVYILNHGPTHGFALMKKAGLSRNTAYKPLQKLETMGLLETRLVEGRPGQPMKQHSLTRRGIWVALAISSNWEMDPVISKWEAKMPILLRAEMWENIKENNLIEEAESSLRAALVETRLETGDDNVESEIMLDFMENMEHLTSFDVDRRLRWNRVLHRNIIALQLLSAFNTGYICGTEQRLKEARIRGEVLAELAKQNTDWERIRNLEQEGKGCQRCFG
jgi:DNA-binding PadR family transcriptional regulator